MPELPAGTVTFLFTDIEGSTRLLQELGDAYADALAEHRRVLRDAFARHGGVEVDTQGDAFFVAFARATDALAAARDATETLGVPIRVRIGIHTGEPLLTEEGYVGIDVHRAARIAAAGHGGQVLVSQSTRDLVGSASLRDLGEHRLKDLTAPERIYQLGEGDFPQLKSLNQTNLPVQPNPLVGRERELGEVLDLLRSHRLVTLTGAGGSGKTRLALQASAELVEEFEHGVWFVPLAAVTDAALVGGTIASVVGAKDDLELFLRERRLLLVLDNLEQLLPDAAPVIASMGAHVLATSRERLNVYGEQEYPVPTLPVGDATTLFTERARQLKPDFEADADVSEIVRRLDGLPLAVELAAARVKVLTTQQIRRRLDDSLGLLTSGAGDVPERQRTLRATVAWSYDLLSLEERELFAKLAVFAGSFELDAAESVCDAALNTVASLIDKSLLRQTEAGRFFMLETIREYASERLDESDVADGVRRRHAFHLLDLAERAEPQLLGPEQRTWLERLAAEEDNLRAALDWGQAHDAELELRLAASIRHFWRIRGPHIEARRRLEDAAQRAGTTLPAQGSEAFAGAAYIAYRQGDYGDAERLATSALDLARLIGDSRRECTALTNLGAVAFALNDFAQARGRLEEALALARADGDSRTVAAQLINLGDVANAEGDYETGARLAEEALAAARLTGNASIVATAATNLTTARLHLDRFDEAAESSREALRNSVELGDETQSVICLLIIAALAEARAEAKTAARLLGFTDSFFAEHGLSLEPAERVLHADTVAALQESLGDAYEHLRREGAELSFEAALAHARALD